MEQVSSLNASHSKMHLQNYKNLEFLEEKFPSLCKILPQNVLYQIGEEFFGRHPIESMKWEEIGKFFSLYLEKSKWKTQYGFLPNLVNFEWMKILSQEAPPPEKFDFTSLLDICEDLQKNIVLKLNPSVYLLKSTWALHKVVLNKYVPKGSYYFIILKNNNEVQSFCISKMKWEILHKISLGLPVGEIIESTNSFTSGEVSQIFFKWVLAGIISRYDIPSK